MLLISSLTTEYVRVPVSATEAGVAVSPVSDTVDMAFVTAGSVPDDLDWASASWEQDASTGTLYARTLVGPDGGDVTLSSGGPYDIYVRIADNPETIVHRVGALAVL